MTEGGRRLTRHPPRGKRATLSARVDASAAVVAWPQGICASGRTVSPAAGSSTATNATIVLRAKSTDPYLARAPSAATGISTATNGSRPRETRRGVRRAALQRFVRYGERDPCPITTSTHEAPARVRSRAQKRSRPDEHRLLVLDEFPRQAARVADRPAGVCGGSVRLRSISEKKRATLAVRERAQHQCTTAGPR